MARSRLSYGDYRPLKAGESGYSKTTRHYVSTSTGNIIPLRKFQEGAKGGKLPRHAASIPSKPRAERWSKNLTRKEAANIAARYDKRDGRVYAAKIWLDANEAFKKDKENEKSRRKRVEEARTKEGKILLYGKERYDFMAEVFIRKENIRRDADQEERVTKGELFFNDDFNHYMDIVKHPDRYPGEIQDFREYFELDDSPYDLGWGDTP